MKSQRIQRRHGPATRGPNARVLRYARAPLYPQREAAIFHPARMAIIEATTKSGKTVGCMAWLTEQAVLGRPGDHFWWVAPVVPQARMVYLRMRRSLPRGTFTANDTRLTITLANGTTLWFKSADRPDSLFGEDVRAAVIDEAPRCKEDAWHAVRTTLTATNGPVRIIGNVKGRRNWAYQLARRAEAGAPDMHYARLTADDAIEAGLFDASELADAEAALPPAVFRALYFAEASDDAGNPFGVDAIQACVQPLSDAEPAVWGWDLAKSRDWTVGIALDEDGRVCRFARFQQPWADTMAAIIRWTGEASALVDSTGVGDSIVELLQRSGGGQFQGWRFSPTSKQQLMEGLALAMHQRRVAFPAGPIVIELEAFEYAYTRTGVRYCAPPGLHDDCVCALALAVRLYATEFGGGPLRLVNGSGPEGGETFVERAIRTHGAFFPTDWH